MEKSTRKTAFSPPPSPPIHGRGVALGYTPAAPGEIAQPGRAVKGKPPQATGRSAPLTARSRLRRDDGGDGGYIPPEPT
ncbi:MAG: hypothetical protein V8R75_07855 [Oscillospiraceae bacterium]